MCDVYHSNVLATPITDRNHPYCHVLQTLHTAGQCHDLPWQPAAANVPRGTADRTGGIELGEEQSLICHPLNVGGGRGGMAIGSEVTPTELKSEKRNITKFN